MTDSETHTTVRGLPAVRFGLLAGITALLCCVGPTAPALLGVVSAGTAFILGATDLYDGYAWWLRAGGLVLLVGLVVWSLRRSSSSTPPDL